MKLVKQPQREFTGNESAYRSDLHVFASTYSGRRRRILVLPTQVLYSMYFVLSTEYVHAVAERLRSARCALLKDPPGRCSYIGLIIHVEYGGAECWPIMQLGSPTFQPLCDNSGWLKIMVQ